MPKTAIAIPCSFGGNVWRRIACSVGCSAPAPRPWMMRKMTSSGSVRAMPQSAEPMTNSARHVETLSEEARQEAGQRHDHDRRDDEAGRDPGDLLDRGAEGAHQVRYGDVDDRRVDRSHQRAERDRDRHQPFVDRRTGRHRRREAARRGGRGHFAGSPNSERMPPVACCRLYHAIAASACAAIRSSCACR